MEESISGSTARIIRQNMASQHGYPLSRVRCLCTAKSYLRDHQLLSYLDSKPLYMSTETAQVLKDLRRAYKWSYKLRKPCSELQNEEAIDSFRARNERAINWRLPKGADAEGWPESRLARVFILAQQLARSATRGYALGAPNHGPGTSFYRYSTRIEKYEWLERDAPYWVWRRFPDFFKPSLASETLEPFQPGRNLCRLACVPKDARGPRLVAPHMASAVWMQQAIMAGLGETFERHPLFRSSWPGVENVQCVQLRDQSVNQRLAEYASRNPQMYATLDLKDASDLVSWRLVCFLLKGTELLRDLWAVRATHVVIDGVQIRLGMHAPMGSATCFPVMGLVLWALTTATAWVMEHEYCRHRPNSRELWAVNKPFVFGDDIIIRTSHYNATKTVLEAAGLTLNSNKCFFGDGGFRESCGHDYYRGYLITPQLLRRDDIDTVEGFGSLVSLINNLTKSGEELFDPTSLAFQLLAILLRADLTRAGSFSNNSRLAFTANRDVPAVFVESPVEAYQLNKRFGRRQRRNGRLQRMEVLIWHLAPAVKRLNSQCRDSRARLYEALAVEQSRDCSIEDASGKSQSFGWAVKRPRAVRSWLTIQP